VEAGIDFNIHAVFDQRKISDPFCPAISLWVYEGPERSPVNKQMKRNN
jgi:hypothetical protein